MSSRVAACAVFCLGVALIAAPAAEAARPSKAARKKAEAAYEQARKAFEADDMAAAIDRLQDAIDAVPEPIYVYNLARALETAGRLRDAYDSFLRAKAMPRIQQDLRDLASAGVERLAELRNKAVLDLSGYERGTVVQVDADLVADTSVPRTLEPGVHQVCAVAPNKAAMVCHRRNLAGGLRTTFPPEGGIRSTLTWPADPAMARLSLGGHGLLLPMAGLRGAQLDAGRLAVSAEDAAGGTFDGEVELLPSATRELALIAPKPATPDVPPDEASTGPGVGPWILLGAGVAAAGTGGALWGLAGAVKSAPDSTSYGDVTVYDKSQTARQAEWDDARTQETAGVVLVGIGTAAVIGGIVWVVVGSGGDETSTSGDGESVTAAPWLAPGAGGATLMGRF